MPPPFTIPAIPAIRKVPAIPPIIPQRAETEQDQRLEMSGAESADQGDVEDITAMNSLAFGKTDEPPTDAGIKPDTTDTSPTGEPLSLGSLGSLANTASSSGGAAASLTDVDGKRASDSALALATGTGERAKLKLPISTAPDSLPPPTDTEQASEDQPGCPQCETPMRWVDEHLRFYCQRCKMYF